MSLHKVLLFTLICICTGVPLLASAEITASEACKIASGADKKILNCDNREAAMKYLESIPCGGSHCHNRNDRAHLEGLDAKFIVCAAQYAAFINNQPGKGICVCQAHRTKEEQLASCYRSTTVCGKKNGCTDVSFCPHVAGIAIDFNPTKDTGYQYLWDNAPQFGLTYYLRSNDPPHAESLAYRMRKPKGYAAQDAKKAGDATNGCLTSGFTPKAQSGDTRTPTQSLSDGLRQALGLNTQQQPTQQDVYNCVMRGCSWNNNQCSCTQAQTQPQLPTSPQTASAQPTSAGTTGTTAGTSGTTAGTTNTTNTTSTKTDPVLACAQESSDPVCGKQTTCPSTVSPNEKCTVGAKKTYLNTCLMNVDNAAFVSQGRCPQTTQDALTSLAHDEPKKDDKKPTSVTLVEDPAATVEALGDNATNAFTAAPKPGTPSYDQQRLTPTQPISQQTFTDANGMPVSDVFTNAQTNTTFVATALTNIVSALSRLQQILTPMRYTTTQYSEDGDYAEAEFIDEEGIEIYVE